MAEYCDGITRRDVLRTARWAVRLEPGRVPAAASGRRSESGEGAVGHLRLARRWPAAPGHVRHEAGCAGRNPRRVQADRHQCGWSSDLRAPAPAGAVCRQVRHRPRRQPYAGRTRAGHRVPERRQPACAVAGLSRLWSRRQQGTAGRRRSAALRGHSQHAAKSRIPGRALRAAGHERHASDAGNPSACAASRWRMG